MDSFQNQDHGPQQRGRTETTVALGLLYKNNFNSFIIHDTFSLVRIIFIHIAIYYIYNKYIFVNFFCK